MRKRNLNVYKFLEDAFTGLDGIKTHLWYVARLKHCLVCFPICFCFIRIFFVFFFALLITLFTFALIKYSIHLYVQLHVAFYKQLHFFIFCLLLLLLLLLLYIFFWGGGGGGGGDIWMT